MQSNQTDHHSSKSDPNYNPELPNQNSGEQAILPRRGWQDKRAFLKAMIKAKRAIDIAEISTLI